ncbi:hypothetical protein N658DRAFT_449929 [Parathielavia hyrcaniae]|uniref:Uncharacterized protein n=1 Tax=Parathielavia hyrcaniae TaxID=113614 RepID=A0AAN6T1W4_9PEZI|nr:hypothetical protein N658DRAFT_449929 [Parathielavia hyrcaniae]
MEANTSQDIGSASSQRGDSDAAFNKFNSYPWARDRSFLQGLMATLGPSLLTNAGNGFNRQKALSTTLQARIWWYKSRFNTDIDRASYEAYVASRPLSEKSPDASILAKLEEIQQRMGGGVPPSSAGGSGQDIPAWQLNAPKVDLSKKADDGASHHANANAGDSAPPYPENFQALIEAVTTGKPIPGIKEIADTVVRPPGVTPFGKMKAPRKPWERDVPSDSSAQASVLGNVVDKEFPPLPSERSS